VRIRTAKLRCPKKALDPVILGIAQIYQSIRAPGPQSVRFVRIKGTWQIRRAEM